MLYTYCVFNEYYVSIVYAGQVEDILVGTLPNFQHGIGGQLYLRDTKTLVIENFSYDGLGVGTWAAWITIAKRMLMHDACISKIRAKIRACMDPGCIAKIMHACLYYSTNSPLRVLCMEVLRCLLCSILLLYFCNTVLYTVLYWACSAHWNTFSYRIACIFRGYTCTANIYNREFNIACMHACCKKAAISQKLNLQKLSKGISAKIYILEIIPAIQYIGHYWLEVIC